jgi:hypothetical protein
MPTILEQALSVAQIAEAAMTAIGIIVAGVWTYVLFVRRRLRYPRAAISHTSYSFRLADGRTLLRVSAKMTNVGEVLLWFRHARTRVQHLYPLPAHIAALTASTTGDPVAKGEYELPWTVLCAREWTYEDGQAQIEPGESEVLHCDFVIPAGVKKVLVYTHVTNHVKRGHEIGWSDTVVVDLDEEVAVHAGTGTPAATGLGGKATSAAPGSVPAPSDAAAAAAP